MSRSSLSTVYLIDKELSEILGTERDLGNVHDTFGTVDVTNIDGFDRQTTSSQRDNHVNWPRRLQLTLQ